MQTIINALRGILGAPDFYKALSGSEPIWDYGAILEYFFSGMIVLIVVGSIFRILIRWGER